MNTKNIPNILTMLRIFLLPFFVVFYFYSPEFSKTPAYNLSNIFMLVVYGIISISDYLDGMLARKLSQTSRFGAFLDPVADKLSVIIALVVMVDFYPSSYHYITLATLVIIAREILVSALREWMSSLGEVDRLQVRYIGKVKTVSQMAAIMLLLYHQPFWHQTFFWLGIAALTCSVILTLFSCFVYIRDAVVRQIN